MAERGDKGMRQEIRAFSALDKETLVDNISLSANKIQMKIASIAYAIDRFGMASPEYSAIVVFEEVKE